MKYLYILVSWQFIYFLSGEKLTVYCLCKAERIHFTTREKNWEFKMLCMHSSYDDRTAW